MVWCCVAWGLNICLFTSGSSGEEDGETATNKTRGRQWEENWEARGFTSEVVSLRVGSVSRTTFAWSMFKRTRYIHVYRFFCIMAERTKPSIHARYTQRSFPFLAERWCKTFTNGTLAKRPVTGPREAFSLFPRVLMFIAVFLAMFIGIPSGSLCGVEWGERAQHRIFFLPPWRDLLVDVSQALRFDERLAIETPLS